MFAALLCNRARPGGKIVKGNIALDNYREEHFERQKREREAVSTDMEAVKELAAAPVFKIPVLPEIQDLMTAPATGITESGEDDILALLLIIAET